MALEEHGVHRVELVLLFWGKSRSKSGRTIGRGAAGCLPDEIDSILVDVHGPPKQELRRYPTLPLLVSRLAADGALAIDGADREGEAAVIVEWQTESPASSLSLGCWEPSEGHWCVRARGYQSPGEHLSWQGLIPPTD